MNDARSGAGLLLTDVDLGDAIVDVRTRGDRITEIGRRLWPAGESVVPGDGGALLPGLHDHHLHLHALAAANDSVRVGPESVRDLAGLSHALRRPRTPTGWIRAVGYHESVAGPLDRDVLDAIVPDRPLRVQHRGGALWMLNSAALDRVADTLDDSDDVERDGAGRPTGRLWRYDTRLRAALPRTGAAHRESLVRLGQHLLSLGITGVTDATPDLDEDGALALADVAPVSVMLMGAPAGLRLPAGLSHGPHKLLLRDHDLPTLDELVDLIDPAGRGHDRRPVGVHCVSRESLILTLAALAQVGPVHGDRIEHAAVVPTELDEQLRALGVTVVTQPDFLRTRGDDYLRDVDAEDRPLLYRWAGLGRAGVSVVASSDAPYGEVDPWQVMRSARSRRTATGRTMGAHEAVSVRAALTSMLTPPEDPAAAPRSVRVGAPADLCLLTTSLREAMVDPSASFVGMTIVGGQTVWRA